MPKDPQKSKWGPTTTWITAGVVSLIWWPIAAQGSLQRLVLIIWLSFASVMVGALIGFLFSSYGEENSTLGKIRDWLIGGITALTVVKASSIKQVLLVFAAGPGPIEFSYTVGASIFYGGLGFFFMFFQRELILNVMLARSRAERGKLEGSQEAGLAIQLSLLRLPPSVVTGVNEVGEIPDVNADEQKQLKDNLFSPDVEKFLEQAEDAANKGTLDWDIASKSAYIRYYRIYFSKDDQSEIDKAIQWVIRALNMNPLHVDLTMKYADLIGLTGDYLTASMLLEKLAMREQAPILVRQWLGYFLRFLPDRLDDAIRYSNQYLSIFPSDSDPLFNIAYAYASKYCQEISSKGLDMLESENRRMALSNLKKALRDQPTMAERVRTKWIEPGKGFECLAKDNEFRELVGANQTPSNPPAG